MQGVFLLKSGLQRPQEHSMLVTIFRMKMFLDWLWGHWCFPQYTGRSAPEIRWPCHLIHNGECQACFQSGQSRRSFSISVFAVEGHGTLLCPSLACLLSMPFPQLPIRGQFWTWTMARAMLWKCLVWRAGAGERKSFGEQCSGDEDKGKVFCWVSFSPTSWVFYPCPCPPPSPKYLQKGPGGWATRFWLRDSGPHSLEQTPRPWRRAAPDVSGARSRAQMQATYHLLKCIAVVSQVNKLLTKL